MQPFRHSLCFSQSWSCEITFARSGYVLVTEPTLAERLAADLDGSFETLVVELQGPVFRFALRYCGNSQDAEEIAQDAFARA
jgi:hypothetical protein